MSSVKGVTETEVRGHPAVRLDVEDGMVYQWMETPGVVARLLVQGAIDPGQAVDALVEVSQATWDETLQAPSPATDQPTRTTAPPTTAIPRGAGSAVRSRQNRPS